MFQMVYKLYRSLSRFLVNNFWTYCSTFQREPFNTFLEHWHDILNTITLLYLFKQNILIQAQFMFLFYINSNEIDVEKFQPKPDIGAWSLKLKINQKRYKKRPKST